MTVIFSCMHSAAFLFSWWWFGGGGGVYGACEGCCVASVSHGCCVLYQNAPVVFSFFLDELKPPIDSIF